jgi:hypothetical protein
MFSTLIAGIHHSMKYLLAIQVKQFVGGDLFKCGFMGLMLFVAYVVV